MLIVALVLAVIGLAALVTAVVTSNEMIAWVCIGASVIGVLLLIVDALRERSRTGEGAVGADDSEDSDGADLQGRDDETTIIPAVSEAETTEITEDYPDDPTEFVDETDTTVADEDVAESNEDVAETKRD